ncbi:uncharacterized protein LOC110982418 isoform X3 [Acanthaster planci]|uniref:Uncharacterized protein LOC110982418 isoform X3 n=1 Tax=Acanthaster planci TaxID=133434 RepID=A0A8B7YT73_ACAPL|nr:uncharacterized protein LOC110982418 isoform X3 [Acanthaster planci]
MDYDPRRISEDAFARFTPVSQVGCRHAHYTRVQEYTYEVYPPTQPVVSAPPINTANSVNAIMMPQPETTIETTTISQPRSYFGCALFVTVWCCLPFGIVALIKANEPIQPCQQRPVTSPRQGSPAPRKPSLSPPAQAVEES